MFEKFQQLSKRGIEQLHGEVAENVRKVATIASADIAESGTRIFDFPIRSPKNSEKYIFSLDIEGRCMQKEKFVAGVKQISRHFFS